MEMARVRRNKNSPDFIAKAELSFPAKLIFLRICILSSDQLTKIPFSKNLIYNIIFLLLYK